MLEELGSFSRTAWGRPIESQASIDKITPPELSPSDKTSQLRGRPLVTRQFSGFPFGIVGSTPSSGESPQTSSTTSDSDREWQRTLADDSDPIHKESGRSRSRETNAVNDTNSTAHLPRGALPISRNVAARTYSTDHFSAFATSSPSNSSDSSLGGLGENKHIIQGFPHMVTLPIQAVEAENRSPLRKSLLELENSDAAGSHGELPSKIDWRAQAPRSLSSTGMDPHRESGRPPMTQRALSINTSTIVRDAARGQFGNVNQQHTFSPNLLRSLTPETGTPGFASSSPPHGLGRLTEGEEATSEAGGFFAPKTTSAFVSSQRHRSTSSAAALQGIGDHTRAPYSPFAHSGSVWGSGPFSADIAGSPGSLVFATGQPLLGDPIARRGRPEDTMLTSVQSGPSTESKSIAMPAAVPATAHAATFGILHDEVVQSGSESRRHSMTAAAPSVIGQRRAFGFDVSPYVADQRNIGGKTSSSTNSAGQWDSFGAGNSVILDNDLRASFDALRLGAEGSSQRHSHSIEARQAERIATYDATPLTRQNASLPPVQRATERSSPDRGLPGWPSSTSLFKEENPSIWNNPLTSPPVIDSSGVRHAQQQIPQLSQPSLPLPYTMSASAHTFKSKSNVGDGAISAQRLATGSSSPKGPSLSDHAIASLVTLGPLAPSNVGQGTQDAPSSLHDLGKGVPLQMLPRDTPLYIVEFKQGRTDLYFTQSQAKGPGDEIRKGDLVIVEADRGKDLGSVINDSITVDQVQTFLTQQAELVQLNAGDGGGSGIAGVHPAANALARLSRSINPKRLFAKAGPSDTSLLHAKAQDEERALTLCSTKVNQRGLPMTVVAAEMQWDRRKLTFYYTATQRVDFRDLVKELFRLYKTRIWMCHLTHPSNNAVGGGGSGI